MSVKVELLTSPLKLQLKGLEHKPGKAVFVEVQKRQLKNYWKLKSIGVTCFDTLKTSSIVP